MFGCSPSKYVADDYSILVADETQSYSGMILWCYFSFRLPLKFGAWAEINLLAIMLSLLRCYLSILYRTA